jgi:hypothetical protein
MRPVRGVGPHPRLAALVAVAAVPVRRGSADGEESHMRWLGWSVREIFLFLLSFK